MGLNNLRLAMRIQEVIVILGDPQSLAQYDSGEDEYAVLRYNESPAVSEEWENWDVANNKLLRYGLHERWRGMVFVCPTGQAEMSLIRVLAKHLNEKFEELDGHRQPPP